MQYLRQEIELEKPPSTAEAIDWTTMLVDMGCAQLTPATVKQTLGLLLKNHHDFTVFVKSIGFEGFCEMLGKRWAGTDEPVVKKDSFLERAVKKKFNPF
jgi:hypothetical protein